MTEEILMLGIGLIFESHSTLLIIHLKRISLCKEFAPLWTKQFFHLWTLKEQKGGKKVRGGKGAKGDGAKCEALILSQRGWGSSKWKNLSPLKKKKKSKRKRNRESSMTGDKKWRKKSLKVKEWCQALKGKLSKEQKRKHLGFLNAKNFQEK